MLVLLLFGPGARQSARQLGEARREFRLMPRSGGGGMPKWSRRTNAVLGGALLICAGIIWWAFETRKPGQAKLTYSEFLERVRSGQVASVMIEPAGDGAPAI